MELVYRRIKLIYRSIELIYCSFELFYHYRNYFYNCCKAEFASSIFSIWVFFHEYSRLIWQQGKGEVIFLCTFYHVHPLHRHLDISQVIATESSLLEIAGNQTRTVNLWIPNASR